MYNLNIQIEHAKKKIIILTGSLTRGIIYLKISYKTIDKSETTK